jgi:hypothetical protein
MATRNRYAEIMAQYAQSQPYSFFGYPQSYTGGYDVSQPQAYAAPVSRYEEIMAQPAMGGGGRGEREAPSAFSLMSPAERAAYYKERPIEGSIALGAQDLFGNFSLMGQIAKNANPDNYYNSRLEKQGYDPEQFAYGPPDLSGGFVSAAQQQQQAVQNAINNTDFSGMDRGSISSPPSTPDTQAVQNAINSTDFSGMDRGGGGGEATGGRDTGGGARDASGGGDRGTRGGFAQGGYVSMMHLGGSDPEGPDDGYAALKDGEYVINDKAVKKYGIELMNAINSGKISKGKLIGLLEM